MESKETAKRSRSEIWNYFTKLSDGKVASCNKCKKEYKIPTGTTKTLINHLEHHPAEFKKYEECKRNTNVAPKRMCVKAETKQSITDAFKSRTLMNSSSPAAQKITKLISKMLATTYLPYGFVEEEGFVDLMKHVAPNYKIPCRTTFSRHCIPALYTEVKRTLKLKLLNDLPNLLSLSFTSDGWSSRAGDSYVSLTCHYLTADFEPNICVLNTLLMNDSHTSSNISKVLKNAVSEWGIDLALQTIPIYCITDNAANFRLGTGTIFIQRSCFAHSLQLAIHDAKNECAGVNTLLSKAKAKAVVGHYSRSSSARERLQMAMKQMSLPVRELIQHVETRWSSEYNMLARLYEVRQAVAAELTNSGSNIDTLSVQEWKLAAGFIEILGPLAEATTEISGDNYPTTSLVIPILHCLKSHLSNIITAKKDGVTFARCLDKALKSRFSLYETESVYCLSMLCDPRFKGALIDPVLALNTLSCNAKKVSVPTYSKNDAPLSSLPSTSDTGLWSTFDVLPNEAPENDCTEELKRYLSEPRIPRSQDPYKWWKEEGMLRFPVVSKVALEYLGIPATSVTSERLFSTTGNIVTSRRENLMPEHVEELSFLHRNLKKRK